MKNISSTVVNCMRGGQRMWSEAQLRNALLRRTTCNRTIRHTDVHVLYIYSIKLQLESSTGFKLYRPQSSAVKFVTLKLTAPHNLREPTPPCELLITIRIPKNVCSSITWYCLTLLTDLRYQFGALPSLCLGTSPHSRPNNLGHDLNTHDRIVTNHGDSQSKQRRPACKRDKHGGYWKHIYTIIKYQSGHRRTGGGIWSTTSISTSRANYTSTNSSGEETSQKKLCTCVCPRYGSVVHSDGRLAVSPCTFCPVHHLLQCLVASPALGACILLDDLCYHMYLRHEWSAELVRLASESMGSGGGEEIPYQG